MSKERRIVILESQVRYLVPEGSIDFIGIVSVVQAERDAALERLAIA